MVGASHFFLLFLGEGHVLDVGIESRRVDEALHGDEVPVANHVHDGGGGGGGGGGAPLGLGAGHAEQKHWKRRKSRVDRCR